MPIKQTLQTNIPWLMNHHRMTYADLDRLPSKGFSTRYLREVVRGQKSATGDKIDAIAKVFGLEGWQLVRPTLPTEILDGDDLTVLIESYSKATREGQKIIADMAKVVPKRD